MTNQYQISIAIWDDNDAEDVHSTLAEMLADHDFCIQSLIVEPAEYCLDCRERVRSLWALAADEELPGDELPVEWEQRCSRHAG